MGIGGSGNFRAGPSRRQSPGSGPSPSSFGLSPLADNVNAITQQPRVRRSAIQHGIGGGMRVCEPKSDFGLRGVSDCGADGSDGASSLTGARVLRALWIAAVVAILAICHVQLRFAIHDLRLQHQHLQAGHRALLRESATLEPQNAYLSDPGRLKDFALNHRNMLEIKNRPEAVVPYELQQKYAPNTIAAARKDEKSQRAFAGPLSSGEKPRTGLWQLVGLASPLLGESRN